MHACPAEDQTKMTCQVDLFIFVSAASAWSAHFGSVAVWFLASLFTLRDFRKAKSIIAYLSLWRCLLCWRLKPLVLDWMMVVKESLEVVISGETTDKADNHHLNLKLIFVPLFKKKNSKKTYISFLKKIKICIKMNMNWIKRFFLITGN